MHVLIRRISPYTAPDLLLGVFVQREDAEQAAAAYIARYQADPAADPWRDQLYVETTEPAATLVIKEVPFAAPAGSQVLVVSDYMDGFGQILRSIDSIHGSREAAEARLDELAAAHSTFPRWAGLQAVIVGETLSDAPEDQQT